MARGPKNKPGRVPQRKRSSALARVGRPGAFKRAFWTVERWKAALSFHQAARASVRAIAFAVAAAFSTAISLATAGAFKRAFWTVERWKAALSFHQAARASVRAIAFAVAAAFSTAISLATAGAV